MGKCLPTGLLLHRIECVANGKRNRSRRETGLLMPSLTAPLWETRSLGQNRLDHGARDIGEAEGPPLEFVSEARVIDA